MGIFDRIKHALFGEAQAAETSVQTTANSRPATDAAIAQGSDRSAVSPVSDGVPATTTQTTADPVVKSQNVDIEAVLNDAVKKSGQKLDWRHSIVDLMKALGMDASLDERKELAAELGYTGDSHDSAKMNMFLHKALMKKLSENGGKVPADLTD